ncbi:hypothetical protein HZY62_05155 [Maribacter polysiphoniae]|uniref:Uncharacterized protein n=1 Tax=Maribacter polysiphoniae TaxID=429344 RepID=A0A316E9K2_9FLAO|nr:hypothetical protein [Maribacter polysiphoniae]MBD1259967.1 hypothetical protein [Maribacter polysiphoniae]PWK25423.1 hypothetical protein LX92_00162 [Maribacter polysiphoniae]
MKRTFVALCAIAVALAFNSCEVDDDSPNFHFVSLPIESVDMPESFELDETYQINLTYTIPDGCTYFEGFDVTKSDVTTREVVAIGSQRTDQEACTPTVREAEGSFDFIVIHTEPYLFRFYQGDDENGDPIFLEIEVPVN